MVAERIHLPNPVGFIKSRLIGSFEFNRSPITLLLYIPLLANQNCEPT